MTIGGEALNVGAEGCKIKGGISRCLQRVAPNDVFDQMRWMRRLCRIFEPSQVIQWAEVLRYPTSNNLEIFEKFS